MTVERSPDPGHRDRSAAQRDHPVELTQHPGYRRELKLTERRLAVGGEDLRDGASSRALNLGIGIEEADPQPSRDSMSDRGLARSHEAG